MERVRPIGKLRLEYKRFGVSAPLCRDSGKLAFEFRRKMYFHNFSPGVCHYRSQRVVSRSLTRKGPL
jgi:hypothetical protein